MSRGRLIWPMTAVIEQYSSLTTANANAGAGFDEDFREPVVLSDGTDVRTYTNQVSIPCQVETERDELRELNMTRGGDNERAQVILVFHFQDLEDNLLVDSSGRSLIKKGDRLVQVLDQDGDVLDDYTSLEMVVTSAEPHSYGLSSGKRNLLIVRYMRRKTGE